MTLYDCLLPSLERMAEAFHDPRPQLRVPDFGLGLLCAEKPKTVTSALIWLGREHQDWSACFHLLSHDAWSMHDLFDPLLETALRLHPDPLAPIYSAQDDSLLRKTGRKTPGTSYARDPLSPPFQVNLVLGQRFLQTSVLMRVPGLSSPARAIPVSFLHTPSLKAPPHSSEQVKKQVKEARRKHTQSHAALGELAALRQRLDRLGRRDRLLINSVDGSFANKNYLRDLPPRTVVVARIRKDAKLRAYLPPELRHGPRKYGDKLPTPEQFRQDESIPWQPLEIFVAGELRTLYYKSIELVCWPQATLDRPLRLIVMKAAGYRLRKGSALLYREPAYLIATSLEVPIPLLIDCYLGRWEIEVNFRDEKTGLGVGQAQVWNPQAVARAPAFLVACYSALLLACIEAFADRRTDALDPLAAWRNDKPLRPSLKDLIHLLRREVAQIRRPQRAAA
jgi:hypothetical protein